MQNQSTLRSATQGYREAELLSGLAYIMFFAALGAALVYQLIPDLKWLTPVVGIAIAAFGLVQPHRFHVGGYLFSAYVVLIALLSLSGIMHRSWTRLFDEQLLIQQASVHALVPLVAIGWATILKRIASRLRTLSFALIVPLSLAIVVVYAQTDQVGMTDSPYVINNLYSIEVFRLFMIAVIALGLKRSYLFFAVLGAFLLFSFSLQALLCACGLLVARYFRVPMRIFWTGLIAVVVVCLLATMHWEYLLTIDNNIGARALFWHNAMRAVWDTGLAGVGYGTESIVPFYPANGTIRYFGPAIPGAYQTIGVHGSFFQILFQTGLVGFLLFFSWLVALVRRVGKVQNGLKGLDVFVCTALVITLFANMATDSYNFALGTSFLIGWLLFRAEASFSQSSNISQTNRGEVVA